MLLVLLFVDYQYIGSGQCIVSLTFCRNIYKLAKDSVSLVLLFVGLSMLWSRVVCRTTDMFVKITT